MKLISYDGKVNTILYENISPKEAVHCVSLSIILIDSVFFKIGKH